MAAVVSTGWTGPDEVRRGSAYVFTLQLTREGSPVALSSATLRVLDRAGTVKATGTATIAPSTYIATWSMAGSITTDEDPQLGWTVEWTTTDASANVRVLVNPVDIVMFTIAPSVTWADLIALHPDLVQRLTAGDDETSAKAAAQLFIDQAWYRVREKLRSRGNRATIVVDSYTLRQVHIYEVLSDVFRSLQTANDVAEQTLADLYMERARGEWDTLVFEVMSPESYSRSLASRSTRASLSLGSTHTGVWRPSAGRRFA